MDPMLRSRRGGGFSGTARSQGHPWPHGHHLEAVGRDHRPVLRTVAGRGFTHDLTERAAERIRAGIPAVEALKRLSVDQNDADAMSQFKAHEKDLGYGFLVTRYAADQDVSRATQADIEKAAADVMPEVRVGSQLRAADMAAPTRQMQGTR